MVDIEELRARHLGCENPAIAVNYLSPIANPNLLGVGTFRALLDDLTALRAEQQWRGIESAHDRSSAEFHQRRGMLSDMINWAVIEYDDYMRDDNYDAQAVLDRIIKRLRDVSENFLEPQTLPPGDGHE